jgi:hypothetical protein
MLCNGSRIAAVVPDVQEVGVDKVLQDKLADGNLHA